MAYYATCVLLYHLHAARRGERAHNRSAQADGVKQARCTQR
jgi:hypothetical protein